MAAADVASIRDEPIWRPAAVCALLAVGGTLLACFGGLIGAFDLHSLLGAGRALIEGRSPYAAIGSASFQAGHAFVYPYLTAWVFVPLSVLPSALSSTAYLGVSVLSIVVACHLLGRPGFLPAALLLSSSTTVISLQMGTVNALLLLGLAVAWSKRRQWVVAGIAVALAAVIKLFLLPLIVWLLVARRWRAAALAGAVLALVLVAGWAVGPLGAHGYATMLNALQGNESPVSWSLASFLHSVELSLPAAARTAVAISAAVLVLGAVGARRSGDERAMFAAAVIASLLATPILWSSYLVVLSAVVLVAASDNRSIALLSVVSWVIVTPDAATPARIACGAALSLGLAVLAIWTGGVPRTATVRRVGHGLRRAVGGAQRRPWLAAFGAVVVAVVADLLLVPPAARSSLPALALIAATGLHAVRAVRPGPAPAAPAPSPLASQ